MFYTVQDGGALFTTQTLLNTVAGTEDTFDGLWCLLHFAQTNNVDHIYAFLSCLESITRK
jgi:hypothetical protein